MVSGDGGFLYNSQELATAVQYGINAVVIVFNNNAYGNVLQAQIQEFNGHILGTQLHNPDFVKLAEAYGHVGIRVDKLEDLDAAMEKCFSYTDRLVFMDIQVDQNEHVYPMQIKFGAMDDMRLSKTERT